MPSRVHSLDYFATVDTLDESATPEPEFVEIRNEQFQLTDGLPGWIAFSLGDLSDRTVPERARARTARNFIRTCIAPHDRHRFEGLMINADPVIRLDELVWYLNQLYELVAGRPTDGPEPSQDSEPDQLRPSTAGTEPEADTPSEASPI